MVRDTARLTQDALALPEEARAALAGALLDSLTPEADPELEESWLQEVARRASELDSGSATAIPWSVVNQRLRSALNRAD